MKGLITLVYCILYCRKCMVHAARKCMRLRTQVHAAPDASACGSGRTACTCVHAATDASACGSVNHCASYCLSSLYSYKSTSTATATNACSSSSSAPSCCVHTYEYTKWKCDYCVAGNAQKKKIRLLEIRLLRGRECILLRRLRIRAWKHQKKMHTPVKKKSDYKKND
jgi:hypothetical protein